VDSARVWEGVVIDPEKYSNEHRDLLRNSHYLAKPPPGAFFCLGVRRGQPGLVGPIGTGPLLGCVLVGRPVAPKLPQDGTVGEITRLVLTPGLPYATASAVLRRAAEVAKSRGMESLISYHDRTRHTGCIYKKAGFRKDGRSPGKPTWGNRPGRSSHDKGTTPKRRWRLEIV